MSLKRFFCIGILALCFVSGAAASAEQINLYFKTSPWPERLRPFSEAATLSLLATAADGKPLTGGSALVRLEAPPGGRLFSTDYPLVEGSELVELRLPLKAGKAEWKYVFPIRGEYRVFVDVVAPDGSTTARTFEIHIREHRVKWLILVGFIFGLFLVGFTAGRIFTRPSAGTACALLALAGCLISFNGAAAAVPPGAVPSGARLDVETPAVGRPARISWELESAGQEAKQTAVLSLAVTHLEKGITVFAVERVVVQGEYSAKFQFADGAEHRVTALAEFPGGKSLRTEKIVQVAAAEPPMAAMLPAVGLFLISIAAGLGAGRWSRHRTAPS